MAKGELPAIGTELPAWSYIQIAESVHAPLSGDMIAPTLGRCAGAVNPLDT